MKPDERALLLKLADGRSPDVFATDVAVGMGINVNRAMYLLEKWSNKGWWNSGISTRSGWMTELGKEAASKERSAKGAT